MNLDFDIARTAGIQSLEGDTAQSNSHQLQEMMKHEENALKRESISAWKDLKLK